MMNNTPNKSSIYVNMTSSSLMKHSALLGGSLVMFLSASLSFASYRSPSYDEALSKLATPTPAVAEALGATPSAYQFESRFDGESSVSYTGQSFRHLVGSDALDLVKSLKASDARAYSKEEWQDILLSYYDFSSNSNPDQAEYASGFSSISKVAYATTGEILNFKEGELYDDVQFPGKQMRDKTAGNDNPLRRGALFGLGESFLGQPWASFDYDRSGEGVVKPEDVFFGIAQTLAERASSGEMFVVGSETVDEAYITHRALDLFELQKAFQWGAVAFSQAARDYLSTDLGASKGLNADNEGRDGPGDNFTTMEHHFDEGYGYFGAARDFENYERSWVLEGKSLDTDHDGKISIKSELNFGFVEPLSSTDEGHALAKDIHKLFRQGRFLVASHPEGYREYVKDLSVVLRGKWETGLALLASHALDELGTELSKDPADVSFKAVAKLFSRAKGLALAFQFSPVAILNDAGFDKLHQLLGQEPQMNAESLTQFRQDLIQARELLMETYRL